MTFSNDICNASYMFKNCSLLSEFKIYNDIENNYDIEFPEKEKNKNIHFIDSILMMIVILCIDI